VDFIKPGGCFLWTIIFAGGLVNAQQLFDHPAWLWFLLAVAFFLLFYGEYLLQGLIRKNIGVGGFTAIR